MSTPTRPALRIIRDEHAALAAMLRTLPMLLDQLRRRGEAPDFAALRAMLFYIDEFPERRHHPKESQLLFPALRARTSEADTVLARLDHDHAHGERGVRDLEHLLLAWEMLGDERREPFEQAARRYVDAYLSHMAVEEQAVLPLAERVLDDADWAALDAAFASNRDPLTGRHEPEGPWRSLFSRIVHRLPAPIGLGPAATDPH